MAVMTEAPPSVAPDVRAGAALHHMLAVLNSEIGPERRQVHVLDVGCGDGHLLLHLHQQLTRLRPGVDVVLHGFDVSDSAVQESGYLEDALEQLNRSAPEVPWSERVRFITSRDTWPYPDESFDFVISNHVLEHVMNHDFVFSEIQRVLRDGGRSMHLFPLGHYVLEGHLKMPFVHWFKDYDALCAAIRLATRLGWGEFRRVKRLGLETDLDGFAERRADFLVHETNYLSRGQVLALAKRHRFRCSFRYTEFFYTTRIRMLMGRRPRTLLRPTRHGILHSILVSFLMWISSVTVVLEKKSVLSAAQPLREVSPS